MKRLKPILLANILILGFITSAKAATLDVCSSSCSYNTIQGAIDAAVDGDDVLVSSGTYVENIFVSGKDITISSVSGAASTIIDGAGADTVVTFSSSENKDIIFDGFTVENGASVNGGGITCDHASPTIRNCLIQNNTATALGGGVYLYYSGATLNNCDIISNTSGSDGGGLYNRYGVVNITRCLISDNTATSGGGGGVNIVNAASSLTNCLISANNAQEGGGISTSAYPVITNCTVTYNTATGNGGGIYCPYSQPVIVNSIFWGNGQQFYGSPATTYSLIEGGYAGTGNLSDNPLFVDAAGGDYQLQIDSPAIDTANSLDAPADDNVATARPQLLGDDMGAYEYVLSGCNPWASFTADATRVLENSTVNFDATGSFNKAGSTFSWDFGDSQNGSGQTSANIYNQSGVYTVSMTVSNTCGNSSLTRDNYIIVKPAGTTLAVPVDFSTIQEAIDAAIDNDTIVIAPGTYTENIDFNGKKITIKSSDGASVTIIDGNATDSVVTFNSGEGATSILEGLTLQNGYATNGGGIYILNSSPTIRDCIISSNLAGSGGGIYVMNGSPAITRTTIIQNRSGLGGGVALFSASAQLTNCLIAANRAGSGGGIYEYMASPVIFNCTIYGNTATTGSGHGIYTFFSFAVVTNTLLWDTSPEITGDSFSFPTFSYCNILGGYTGTGNINSDPLLIDPAGGNYYPQAASTLINTGTNTDAPTLDLNQNTRDATVDIGALEFFVVNTDPTVTVNAPNGGETFTNNSLAVQWTATDAEQQGADELKAAIYYRRGAVGSWTPAAGNIDCTHNVQATYNWDISGLGEGVDYTVRILITDNNGGSGEDTSDAVFTIDNSGPSFDGISSATDDYTNGAANLSWNAASDLTPPITYNIYYATTSGGQNFATPNTSTQSTSKRITGLTNGQEYFFVVRAEDSYSNEDTNVVELSTTPTQDVTPPTFSGLVSATDPNYNGMVDLSWGAASDPNSPITYNIYYAMTSGDQNFSTPDKTTQSTSYRVTGLNNGQIYYFVVRAEDTRNNEDTNTVEFSSTPTLDGTPPTFAGVVSATDANIDGAVDLSWSAATEPNGQVTYNIYYATNSGNQNFATPDDTTQSTSYQVTGLTNGQIYYFVVRAEDVSGNEEINTVQVSSTPTMDATAPSFSGLASATDPQTDGAVDLSWSAATEPNGPVTYNIYYSITSGTQNFTTPDETTQDTSYQVTGLTNDQIYYFVVRAEDPYGNEETNADELSATPTIPSGDIPAGAVAYWKFDEGSGGSASDETDNANDGTINGASWTAAGKTGNALSFDGNNDYVNMGNDPSLDLGLSGDSFTLEAWIKPNNASPTKWGGIITKDNYTVDRKRNYWLGQRKDHPGIYFGTRNAADTGIVSWRTKSGLVIGDWNYIVLVWDRTANDVILYINGVEKSWSELDSGPPFDIPPDYDRNVTIGMAGDINRYPFDGFIDEVIIYNKALSAAEVQNRFSDNTPPTFSGLESATDANTDGAVDLSWSAASDSSTPITYNIYYAPTSGTQNFATPDETTQDTSYQVTGLTNDQIYYFVVRAEDAYGNEETNSVERSATPTTSSGNIPAGAVAYWKFDEGSGGTVSDETDNANNGTINGASWTAGETGNALNFDGIDDGVEVANHTSLNPTDAITIEAWIKTVPTPNNQYIVTRDRYENYQMTIRSGYGLRFWVMTTGGTAYANGGTIPDNTWTHVVGTYDGSVIKVYVDGVEVGSDNSISGTIAYSSPGPLRIGKRGDSQAFYTGGIDEVVIYGRSLSAFEVQDRYSGGGAPDSTPPTFSGLESATDANTDGAVDLSWSAASDPSTPITYNIYYATGSGGQNFATPDDTTQGTSYQVTGLTNDQIYYFVVRAEDPYGNEETNADELSATPTIPSGDIPAGAVAYWEFDEGSGGTAFDETDNANNGTINGASWTTGKTGNALNFDGIDDGVEVANHNSLNPTDAITIEAWIKTVPTPNNQYIVTRDRYENYQMTIRSGNGLRFWVMTTGGTAYANGGTIPDNTWTHVVGTYDGSVIKVYVDGVEVGSDNSISGTIAYSSPGPLRMGKRGDSQAFHTGGIDEMVIYGRSLSASEVQDRYNSF